MIDVVVCYRMIRKIKTLTLTLITYHNIHTCLSAFKAHAFLHTRTYSDFSPLCLICLSLFFSFYDSFFFFLSLSVALLLVLRGVHRSLKARLKDTVLSFWVFCGAPAHLLICSSARSIPFDVCLFLCFVSLSLRSSASFDPHTCAFSSLLWWKHFFCRISTVFVSLCDSRALRFGLRFSPLPLAVFVWRTRSFFSSLLLCLLLCRS